MADLQAIHDEIYRIREKTDASREVRQNLQSIEQSLSGLQSGEDAPGMYRDRLKEVRAELDRLADDADDEEVTAELDRLREQVRELERDET
ncbi:hypothetical protein [Halorussus litoreus]|uniref:hypothetical protein n=1 Tax=Halorussus litoreus TaxID=1710536 RepID=UPI000E267399|nr:hypothetical protein [Halorussus litoreus]